MTKFDDPSSGAMARLVDALRHGEAPRTLPRDALTKAFASMTPEEIVDCVINRTAIDQANGMLMALFSIDVDRAFELLR